MTKKGNLPNIIRFIALHSTSCTWDQIWLASACKCLSSDLKTYERLKLLSVISPHVSLPFPLVTERSVTQLWEKCELFTELDRYSTCTDACSHHSVPTRANLSVCVHLWLSTDLVHQSTSKIPFTVSLNRHTHTPTHTHRIRCCIVTFLHGERNVSEINLTWLCTHQVVKTKNLKDFNWATRC